MITVSAQRVNIDAEFHEQPVQFIIRGNLKNVECIIPLIHHMYRSFLRVVHLKSLLIFGSRLKRRVPFSLGLITQTSYIFLHLCINTRNLKLLFQFMQFVYTFFHIKINLIFIYQSYFEIYIYR